MGDGSGGCLQRSVSVPVTGGDGWSFGFRIAGGGRASIGRCRDPDAPVGPAAGGGRFPGGLLEGSNILGGSDDLVRGRALPPAGPHLSGEQLKNRRDL